MSDEGQMVVKLLRTAKIMLSAAKEVPANFVPAAAVKRGERALFVMTGRKGFVGGFRRQFIKTVTRINIGKCKLEPWGLEYVQDDSSTHGGGVESGNTVGDSR